jgi:glycosyltransferase involved in cell wall biosynthesis
MKILHTIYDDVDNPWCGGGGAVRAMEINRRIAHNHDITLLTGNFPGAAPEEDRYGIRIRRAGTNRNYALSRLSFSALASRALAGWPFDLWVYDFSAFSPVYALPSRQARSVMVFHHSISAHATRKYPGIGLLAAAAEGLHTRLHRRIIAVSPSTALHLERRARRTTPIHTICNGVNRPPVLETREEDYILFFGRLDTYNKGIDILLPAFARLRPAHPDVRLVLAGRGTEARLRELKAISRSLGISDRVELTGPVSETEKWDLYAGALFTCQPSRYEGWGIAAIEAGAAGKAVIGTAIPGLVDAIRRDRTGLLVPAEDTEALTGAMKLLLEDPRRRADLGRNGRKWAASFSWDRIALEQERVYAGSLG